MTGSDNEGAATRRDRRPAQDLFGRIICLNVFPHFHDLHAASGVRRLSRCEGIAVRGQFDDWRGDCLCAVPDSARRHRGPR
jgi:hypothetical protein